MELLTRFLPKAKAIKVAMLFVGALLLVPFVGLAPFIFLLLYKTAVAASHVALASVSTAEKRRMPFGLMLVVTIAVAVGIYGLWPASSAAPAAMPVDLDRLHLLGAGPLEQPATAAAAPGFVVSAMLMSAKLFGSAPTAGSTLVSMIALVGVFLAVVAIFCRPYLSGDPRHFAADAEGLFQLTRANRLGSIARDARREVERFLGGFKGSNIGERMTNAVEDVFKSHPDPLVRGNLAEAAEALWPYDRDWQKTGNLKNIELHTEMPADLARAIVWDGVLITGQSTAYLAPRLIARGHLDKSYESSIRASLPAEGAIAVSGYFLAAAVFFGVSSLLVNLVGGGWIMTLLAMGFGSACAYAAWRWHAAYTVLSLSSAALRPVNIAPVLNRIVNSRPDLLTPSKDSIVRRKERLDVLRNRLWQWRKQIQIALRDPFKRVVFGTATGSALARGDLNGFLEGQDAAITSDDGSRGGIFVKAPSGAGKSFAILNPLMAQAMQEEVAFFDEDVSAQMAVKDDLLENAASTEDAFVAA